MAAEEASAQACCTSTGASYLSVAEKQHAAVVSFETSYERGIGTFDSDGDYRALSQASVDDLIFALSGALRLGESDFQLVGKAPLRFQHRKFRGIERATAFDLGDVRLEARFTALEDPGKTPSSDPKTWLFGITPFVGILAPTGGAPEDTEEPTGVDITGDGAWTALIGVELIKSFGLFDGVDLEASYGYRLERSIEARAGLAGRTFAPGDEIQLRAAYTHKFDLYWAAGVLASLRLTLPARAEGETVTASATRRPRAGLFVARFLTYPTWQLRLQVLADPPIDGFGKNVPFSGPTFTLSLMRAFSR